MANSGTLSDAELAAQFAHYGEHIQLPIKPNKRPILLKKLNHLKARANAQESPSQKARSKFKINPNPVVPPSSAVKYLPIRSRSRESNSDHAEEDEPSTSNYKNFRPSPARLSPRNRSYEATSEDDFDQLPGASCAPGSTSRTDRTKGSSLLSVSTSGTSNMANTKDSKREPQFSDSILRTLRRRTGEPPPRQNRRKDKVDVADSSNDVPNKQLDGSDDEMNRPSPARSRSRLYPDLGRITSYLSRSKGAENAFESSDSDLEETNVSTYEVENKSVNTSFPLQSQSYGKRDGSMLHTSDSSLGSFSNSPGTSTRFRSRRDPNSRVQIYKSWYLESLPQLLVCVAVLFFAVITVTYIATHKDYFISWFSSSSNMGYGDHILMCINGIPNENKKCYGKEEIDRALGIIETIFKELSVRKGQVLCDASRPGEDVLSVALLEHQIDSTAVAKTNANRLFRCCLDHILVNPHWNLRALRADGTSATTVEEVVRLESLVADMTLWCRLCRSFTQVLYGICLITVVIGCIFLGSVYLKHKLKQQETEQREVFTMVEKIIDLVQEHHEQNKGEVSDEPPYLAVQHVRDQLLPPSRR
ncbi:hypothetical protein EGW08_005069 [Elysia chlorotica]|uniref:LEM domain-containing protein n=1 Tax=Elysia chlorotica TaxID=188477 RepID=A0A433TZZ0_ELYCH|nr:hypothetical protein EGW08_005069 [Elysia chlorotica]